MYNKNFNAEIDVVTSLLGDTVEAVAHVQTLLLLVILSTICHFLINITLNKKNITCI